MRNLLGGPNLFQLRLPGDEQNMISTSAEMLVFSQRTSFNDKLSSLLSEVLLRRLEPGFVEAVLKKRPHSMAIVRTRPSIVFVRPRKDLVDTKALLLMVKRVAEQQYGFKFYSSESSDLE